MVTGFPCDGSCSIIHISTLQLTYALAYREIDVNFVLEMTAGLNCVLVGAIGHSSFRADLGKLQEKAETIHKCCLRIMLFTSPVRHSSTTTNSRLSRHNGMSQQAHLHGGNFQGGRQVRDDCIQKWLHSLVLEGTATEDGHKLVADAALANQLLQRLFAWLLTLQGVIRL